MAAAQEMRLEAMARHHYHKAPPYLVWDPAPPKPRRWLLGCMQAVFGAALIGLVAAVTVAIYLGVFTSLYSTKDLTLKGRLRLEKSLFKKADNDTTVKEEKRFYKNMLGDALRELGSGYLGAEVRRVSKQEDGPVVDFEIRLMKRQSVRGLATKAKETLSRRLGPGTRVDLDDPEEVTEESENHQRSTKEIKKESPADYLSESHEIRPVVASTRRQSPSTTASSTTTTRRTTSKFPFFILTGNDPDTIPSVSTIRTSTRTTTHRPRSTTLSTTDDTHHVGNRPTVYYEPWIPFVSDRNPGSRTNLSPMEVQRQAVDSLISASHAPNSHNVFIPERYPPTATDVTVGASLVIHRPPNHHPLLPQPSVPPLIYPRPTLLPFIYPPPPPPTLPPFFLSQTSRKKRESSPKVIGAYATEILTQSTGAKGRIQANRTDECYQGILCKNGMCTEKGGYCDRKIDCSDGSDESYCKCVDYLRLESQDMKVCDGIVDCWDGSDEYNCSWCQPNQFQCPNAKECIEQTKVCDGEMDCPRGMDEHGCLKFAEGNYSEGVVVLQAHGQWGQLCVDNVEQQEDLATLGMAICVAFSFSDFKTSSIVKTPPIYPTNYILDVFNQSAYGQNTKIINLIKETPCSQGRRVRVTCKDLECGTRPLRRGPDPRVVGGQGVKEAGSWPWQAAMYKEGRFQCGAVLVADRWLLSAAHCFLQDSKPMTFHWEARLGLIRRATELPSPHEVTRAVTHLAVHPGYRRTGFLNDLVLLRMESPVPFSDYLRPVCLPSPNDHPYKGQMCVVIGWGKLRENGNYFPDTLQEAHLPLMSAEECRRVTLFLPFYEITQDMLCAGYAKGGHDACLGDSGGPLLCQEADGRWTVTGITSHGDGCGRPHRPGVYTRVSSYLAWIDTVMGSAVLPTELQPRCTGHRCPLGKCLPHSQVCDGSLDCRDGSDEAHCITA